MTFFKNKVNAKDYIIDMETEGLNKDVKGGGREIFVPLSEISNKEYIKVHPKGKIKHRKPTNVTPKKKKRKKR